MPVQELTYRLVKGSPLTPLEGDNNLRYLTNATNALFQLFGVALNPDGTLKPNSVTTSAILDRSVTLEKLAFLTQFYAEDTGIADNYVITFTPPATAYAKGMLFFVLIATTNTGASVINVDGLGDKSIYKYGTEELSAGDLIAGSVVVIAYDGTQFQLVSTTIPADPVIVNPSPYGHSYATLADGTQYANATLSITKPLGKRWDQFYIKFETNMGPNSAYASVKVTFQYNTAPIAGVPVSVGPSIGTGNSGEVKSTAVGVADYDVEWNFVGVMPSDLIDTTTVQFNVEILVSGGAFIIPNATAKYSLRGDYYQP